MEGRLEAAAKRYEGRAELVQSRRDAWPFCKEEVILPVLGQAAEVLSDAGLTCYTKPIQFERHDLVQFWTANKWTGESWRLESGGIRRGCEYSAAMTYEIQPDGRVAHWHFPHKLDNAPTTGNVIYLKTPGELDQATVRRDVLAFLEVCWESSYLGERYQGRPIGFRQEEPVAGQASSTNADGLLGRVLR